MRSLGSQLSIGEGAVTWSLCEAKKEAWLFQLNEALASDQLSPGDASKLHGRLNFACQKVFGKVGRAAMRPICHRQTQQGVSRLGPALRSALVWWRRFLSSAPCATIRQRDRLACEPEYVLFTDAEGTGGVGAFLAGHSSCAFIADRLPSALWAKLKKRRTQINVLELCACWLALHTFAERLRGCKILMLIDNTCALHMAIKGGSKCSDANELLHSMWLIIATHSMHIRFEYVESKKNMADGPSRGSLDIVRSAGAEEVHAIWPSWPVIE